MVVGAISMMRLAMISHLLEILRSSKGSIKYRRRSGINQVLQNALPAGFDGFLHSTSSPTSGRTA